MSTPQGIEASELVGQVSRLATEHPHAAPIGPAQRVRFSEFNKLLITTIASRMHLYHSSIYVYPLSIDFPASL
jgi:hypothetical protein